MNKLPAFQFYPADWRKDPGIQALTYEQRGVWFEMLCIMHESKTRGFLKINDKKIENSVLARLLGLTAKKTEKIVKVLLEFDVCKIDESGVMYCKRMVNDEHIRQVRAEAGSKGGSPLLKQTVKQTCKQILTPSSSSSSSSSITSKYTSNDAHLLDPQHPMKSMDAVDRMIDIFIENAPSQPKPSKKLSHIRKTRLMDRFNDLGRNLLKWESLCMKIEKSDFLSGRTDRGFIPGLDWIIDEDHFNKINEGNYTNRNSNTPNHADKYIEGKEF